MIPTAWGTWAKFWLGFSCGIVAIAIAIEIVRAFATHETEAIFFGATAWLGRFQWLYEYQTLITGLAAVYAASMSVRTIRDQIKASDLAAQRQIDHSAEIEKNRNDAKNAAARATLPLTLSTICDYSENCGSRLYNLLLSHPSDEAIKANDIPQFPPVPSNAAGELKEMIEYCQPSERPYISSIIREMQVQSSRLRGMSSDSRKGSIRRTDVISYLADSVEIYARASELFEFARDPHAQVPSSVSSNSVSTAVHVMGVWNHEIMERVVLQVTLTADGSRM